jgi:hypothetical protein
MRSEYKILIGRPEEIRPLARRRHRLEKSKRIIIDLRCRVVRCVDRIHLAQDTVQRQALVKTVMKHRVREFLAS